MQQPVISGEVPNLQPQMFTLLHASADSPVDIISSRNPTSHMRHVCRLLTSPGQIWSFFPLLFEIPGAANSQISAVRLQPFRALCGALQTKMVALLWLSAVFVVLGGATAQPYIGAGGKPMCWPSWTKDDTFVLHANGVGGLHLRVGVRSERPHKVPA